MFSICDSIILIVEGSSVLLLIFVHLQGSVSLISHLSILELDII